MNPVIIIVMVLVICVICSSVMGGGYYLLQEDATTPVKKPDSTTTDVAPKTDTPVTPKTDTSITPKADTSPSSITQWASFTVGQSVNCSKGDPKGDNSGAIYRYIGNSTISHYPSPSIASSWDPAWGNPKTIDCTGITKGADMTAKTGTTTSTPAPISGTPITSATPWASFTAGQAVNCNAGDPKGANSGAIYRYTGNNTMSWYPTASIASSWDPAWGNPKTINCTGLNKGTDMTAKTGTTVVSSTSPTSSSLNSLRIGQAVKCLKSDPKGDNSGAIYRYNGGNTINHYVDAVIAGSWDPTWQNPETVDCTGVITGPPITMPDPGMMATLVMPWIRR